MDKRKILLSLTVLGSLLASLALSFNIVGTGIQHSLAQSPGVTATDFYINSGQEPWGTTFDSKGNVWVAVPGCDPAPNCNTNVPPGKIEEYNPVASSWIATYQLPSGYAQPLFLAFDAQGNLWFPMPMANSIGMLNLQSRAFQQFPVPTAGAGPWDIAIDHNGKIWFTENNSAVALIGEYTSGGTLNEYKISNNPPGGLTPHLITVDSNGNIWWSEGWVGKIGNLNRAQAVPGTNNGVTEYAYQKVCGSCSTHTSGIGVDGYGQIWFDDSQQSIFGSFPDTGTGSFSLYQTPTQNSHPHDGLNVDLQNRVWFTEEFVNKLAVAVQNSIPTPTPTSSSTVTPSPTPSPGLTPSPTVGTTLAQDTFQRPNQALWGTASDGQTWGGDANTASAFSIVNNTGQVANAATSYSATLGPIATNAEVLFSGSLSSFSNSNLGAVLRWTDGNNLYKAYIDGTSLVIQKRFHNATTTLGSVPFAATAGTSYTLRFRVVGSTLSAKVWQTGSSEPASWMVMVTDTSFSSGFCGLRMLAQNGAIASYTSFQALSE